MITAVPDALEAEVALVILDPLDAYPWLREHGWTTDGPSRPPARIPGYHVVAFTTVARRGDGGPYARRIWFVKADDRAIYGDRDWPIEAVDPASIAPRRASRSMGLPPWRSEGTDAGRAEGRAGAGREEARR